MSEANGAYSQPSGSVWVDDQGQRYTDDEVEHRDVDTMGPQFLGWITMESGKSNCINDWVRVHCRQRWH